MKKLIILLIIIFLTSGCKSYLELNDLAIINAIGIEKQNDQLIIYFSLVSSLNTETMTPKTKTYTVKGNNINNIIEDLSLTLSKKIYISHLNLLLINDTIKTNDLENIINFFLNNSNSREDFLVAYTKNIKKILEEAKFNEINDLIEINKSETSKVIYTTMYDVINNFYLEEKIYFTNLKYDETIKCEGLQEFSNNSYKYIKEDEALFINYTLNNIDTYKYSYECEKNKFLYLNVLNSHMRDLKDEFIITNEIKVITNDCNYRKDEINQVINDYLENNISKLIDKKMKITNTIRGNYENK